MEGGGLAAPDRITSVPDWPGGCETAVLVAPPTLQNPWPPERIASTNSFIAARG